MDAFDVAIVGGGPAGLSAALVFARAGRRVALIDAGPPRNHASPGVQGFLSRDGISPAALRAISREQIEVYGTVAFLHARARSVRPHEAGGFTVEGPEVGSIDARFVFLAVGMVDILPAIPRFDQLWGRDIIHCAFCHGWESRNRSWGLIARSETAVESAHRLLHWTDDLVVFAEPDLAIAGESERQLADHGIRIVRQRIENLVVDPGGSLTAVELSDGSRVARNTLVYQPAQRHTEVVLRTGVEVAEGRVRVDANHETSVRGIFAGGDLTAGHQDVPSATACGAAIAKTITHLLADRVGPRG